MAIWPFNSKQPDPKLPKLQNDALQDLSRMFLENPQNPTPGNELIDVSRFDFTVESLGAMDEHLETMRARSLQGNDLISFVLRSGAYVGEVIRRHSKISRKWNWVDYDQAVQLDQNLVQFGKSLGTVAILWDGEAGFIYPLSKVLKFLENGPEDSVKFYAEVIIALPPTLPTSTQ